ncbi:MAG: glycosyltransferase, partial [Flavobacteriaceae bacterium]|nr:glycosyltransferase [Flavobacteriaceae bacterium]
FIDQDNVKYWFCSSDLIIQPYKKASQSGITPLALQFETPTVCTNVGGLSEIILNEKDGFLCNPNVKDLEKKILTALDYNQDMLKAEIKIKKKKLTWDVFVNQLINNIHYE